MPAELNGSIQNLFRYIENNMPADLETELLSGVGYMSRGKLYYDFYDLSGHSVKEYIRKRRLSNALALIKASELELTDIALRCGYSSHQALCRAVRQTLGTTPSDYKNGDTYFFFPPWSGRALQSVTVSNGVIPETLRLYFYHPKLAGIEDEAMGAFLRAFPDYGGRVFGRNGKQNGGRFCYELYVTDAGIDRGAPARHGLEPDQAVPRFAAVFAATVVPNDERRISAAWDYLYSEWLQGSMFEYTGEPYFEEYVLKNGKPAKLRLYLPIRKRAGETKITLLHKPGLRFVTAGATGFDAEGLASRTVFDYLTRRHPHVLKTSKEIYIRRETNACVCGVRVDPGLRVEEDKNIAVVDTGHDNYLVLESGVAGDYGRYAGMLLRFARDNGMDADASGVFAVYDGSGNLKNPKIKMYLPVKNCTK